MSTDKNGVEILSGLRVKIDCHELRRADGTTYHVIEEETCVVMSRIHPRPRMYVNEDGRSVEISDTLYYHRQNGGWVPPVLPGINKNVTVL